jgi:hypothetical protein
LPISTGNATDVATDTAAATAAATGTGTPGSTGSVTGTVAAAASKTGGVSVLDVPSGPLRYGTIAVVRGNLGFL